MRAAALVEGHRHRLALEIEDGVERVDRARPSLGREVELVLVADREVELGLQRVEQQVDLVHDEHAAAEEAEHLHQRADVVLHARVLLPPLVAQHVELLEQLELERLHRRRRAHHDAAVARRTLQLVDRRPPHLARAVEREREDALADDRRERRAQRRLRLLEQRGRHRLHDERLAVAEEEGEQRARPPSSCRRPSASASPAARHFAPPPQTRGRARPAPSAARCCA